MELINEGSVKHDLMLNAVDEMLMEKEKTFIVEFAPKYNYITNTLYSLDLNSKEDMELLSHFVDLFDLPESMKDGEFFSKWKDELYQVWFSKNSDKISKMVTNGKVSYYYHKGE